MDLTHPSFSFELPPQLPAPLLQYLIYRTASQTSCRTHAKALLNDFAKKAFKIRSEDCHLGKVNYLLHRESLPGDTY